MEEATKLYVQFVPRPLRTDNISSSLSCSGFGIKVTTTSVSLPFGPDLSNDKSYIAFTFTFPCFQQVYDDILEDPCFVTN